MQNDKKKQYKISKGETKLSLLVNAIFLEKQENQSTIQTRAAGWNKDHLEKKKNYLEVEVNFTEIQNDDQIQDQLVGQE